MTDQNPTVARVVAVLQAIDADIPKLQSLINSLSSSTVMTGIIGAMFPNVKDLLPHLQEVAPYLSFLKSLDEEILKAIQAVAP